MSSSVDRVAMFVPTLLGGGAERNMVNLATGLARAGRRVDLVVANAVGPYLGEVDDRVRVVDLGRARTIASAPGLFRHLRRSRPPVLLSTLNHANVVALAIARVASPSTRVFVREANTASISVSEAPSRRARVIPWLMRALYPRAAGVIAPSDGVAQDLSLALGLDGVEVIANPVVTPDLEEACRAPVGHPFFDDPTVPVVLGAGRLSPQKDFETLLQAFARARATRRMRLLILGEGSERARLVALSRALGIEQDVSLPGFVGNPFAYMARASLFVLSSRWEGLPNVLIQAMACGCRVVSTDCESGPREILRGGELGPLVPVQDAEALAAAMEVALDRPAAPEAQREAVARFDLDAITARYLALFERRG